MTQAIVGTWYMQTSDGGTDQLAATFLADGTFLIADKGTEARDPNGTSGLEWGQYTWNETTGALTMTFAINTDGQWGFSQAGITKATVADNVLSLTGFDGSPSISRLISPPGSVVGSWYHTGDTQGGTDQIVFNFLNDGTVLIADKGTVARDPNGKSGIEWGTYTWDPETGAASVTIAINTDGEWGFASKAGETVSMTLHPGVDSMTVMVSDGDGATLQRLSPLAGGAITGTAGADTIAGTGFVDTIAALGGNDSITGAAGNDIIDGGAGIDTAYYSGAKAGYVVAKAGGSFTVTGGSEGTDTLTGVERLHFSTSSLALDLDGNAGNVARIIGAVFGAPSLTIKEYVGIGLAYLDGGMSYQDLMQLAIGFKLGAGAANPASVVNLLYGNVIGGAPPADLLAQYSALLSNGSHTNGSLGVLAAALPQNEAHINLVGLAQTGIEFV